jgi:2-iminobutanoate/2-iminopropanoate deaminase
MEPVYSPHAPKPIGPYSQAIKTGDFLFLSGQIPLDPVTGKLVEGDIQAQTRRVLENIHEVLKAGGVSLKQIVKTTVFMLDLKEFSDMNAVYSEYFGSPFPARSTIQVAGLPANARVEIEVVASLK